MKILIYILILLSLIFSLPSFGQEKLTKIIKAKVVSKDDGLGVIGATVIIKGTNKGVAVDIDGNFEINAKATEMIEISAVGFVTRCIKAADIKTGTSINLVVDQISLKEIAVVGYGVQERRDITGSVTSVSTRELEMTPVSVDNALAGRVSGMLVSSSSGQPGSATSIVIRGLSSLNGDSNNPLIVIDGVPVYGSGKGLNSTNTSSTSTMAASIGGNSVSGSMSAPQEFERNPLSNINPDDIESVEVLKDAFATAIYGSRGSAGVIIITTKKGIKGKPKVDLTYSLGVSNVLALPSVLDAEQYKQVYNKYMGELNGGSLPETSTSTNWLDEVTRSAISHNTSVGISAGSDNSTYYLSLSDLQQESYIIGNDFERTSARLNFVYDAKESISFGTNISASFTDNNSLNAQSIYQSAVLRSPIEPIYKEDGSYYYNSFRMNDTNPLQVANDDINYLKDTRIVGNVFGEYKPLSWLAFKSEMGVDIMSTESYSRIMGRDWLQGGSARQTNAANRKFVMNNTLSAAKIIGDHNVNVVVGQSFENSRENRLSISGNNFSSDNVISISSAKRTKVDQALVDKWAVFSAFTRVNYQFLNRYMAGVTYRLDGSSRFNKNSRYIGFPSFSFGWRASEESFLSSSKIINDLKFRGSIGFTGTDGSGGYYGNQGVYQIVKAGSGETFKYGGYDVYYLTKANNPNLKWEKTKSYDIGFDAELLDNRVKINFDYYYKKIENMITSVNIPSYRGFSSIQRNFGDMLNSGFEIQIFTENIKNDFLWTTNFNIASNTNKVLRLNISQSANEASGNTIYVEGMEAPLFYLYDWRGVDPITGNPIWGKADGSTSQTAPHNDNKNKKEFGSYFPDFYGGLTNTFNYNGFELSAFLSFSYGGQMLNGTKAQLMNYFTTDKNNLHTDILKSWIIAGHNTEVPKFINGSVIVTNTNGNKSVADYTSGLNSSRFLEDNSYLRLKTLTLSYSISSRLLSSLKVRRLKMHVQVTNLFTITNYSGVDPEVSAFGSQAVMGGYDLLTMPQVRTYQFGVNIGL